MTKRVDIDVVSQVISKHVRTCSQCGGDTKHLVMTDKLTSIPLLADLGEPLKSTHVIPAALVTCYVCGHITFFNIAALGLLKPSTKISKKTKKKVTKKAVKEAKQKVINKEN